jgi:hypothetical protein
MAKPNSACTPFSDAFYCNHRMHQALGITSHIQLQAKLFMKTIARVDVLYKPCSLLLDQANNAMFEELQEQTSSRFSSSLQIPMSLIFTTKNLPLHLPHAFNILLDDPVKFYTS